ncbi:MAG: TM0106 family RecB-like putative nuclease, partial [Gemmatimonadota bacterium]
GALLQVLLYADLLAQVQGAPPEHVHIALGGPEPRTESFRVAEYAAYFRSVRERFLAHVQHASPRLTTTLPAAPEPVTHCDICAWSMICEDERRAVDHLSLVAGISAHQRRALDTVGITTLEALANIDDATSHAIDGVSAAGLARIRAQAAIQLEGRRTRTNVHELLRPITPGQGLAALPTPSPGDLFFDLEGDPYALTHGIEYLFGFTDADGSYTGWWALDRESERRAFERFIDFVMHRREQYPDLHIYHYNHYETTALKRLMGRYATREDEVDTLLRAEVFVDLYRVVKQGLRASVESYSIKKLEPFYGYTRDVDLRAASRALAHFEAWLELGGESDTTSLIADIEGYNRDDCVSTLRLHAWLESLRDELIAAGEVVERPAPGDGAMSEAAAERDAAVDALVARLLHGERWSGGAEERWLMAQLLEYHRREDKSFWWEYYRCLDLSDDELVEDAATLGGLTYDGIAEEEKRSYLHRYRFPPQDHKLKVRKAVVDPATEGAPGVVTDIDDAAGIITLKRGKGSQVAHPGALVLKDNVNDRPLRESVFRVGEAIADHGLGPSNPYGSAVALLGERGSGGAGEREGKGLKREGETPLEAAVRLVGELDHAVLPIQGPPGAGKTYTAARMIVRALQNGQRVGVTAQSHKVIGNLLEEVCRAGEEAGVAIAGMQKADDEQRCNADAIVVASNEELRDALAAGDVRLAGGTAWLWSREDMIGSVDVLFIDEAGQFSLASAVAVAPAARSLVLVGDPQQLEQPVQGVHPPGVDVSALDHLLGGAHTVPPERGLFLDRTWRLHPTICAFTSEIFYDGRLEPRPGLERQMIRAHDARLNGSGLRFIGVEHIGNTTDAPEEVAAVAGIVAELLRDGCTWTDASGVTAPIRIDDILVVAPYNAQVSALIAALPPGARVGTVDKFQGQEAPVVIYSMTTSSALDAPRGMAFLYSPNRLNVATSRAKCLAVVVASPALFAAECRTPEQMRLANAFCRFAELAEPVDPAMPADLFRHGAG